MIDAEIVYPTLEEMIEFNFMVLNAIKMKKADKNEILSYQKLRQIINGCRELKGDIYDKAVYLMKETIKQHAFASGNRRTAFIITKSFLNSNNSSFNIEDHPEYARIMTGIRDNYYDDAEIKNWIKNGKIRVFKRR